MDEERVSIEPATRADVDAIHRIEEASFPAPWRREFFVAELESDGRFTIVARRRGSVVGYLFAMWIFDELHVNKIAVAESARRQGIADRLMDRCLDFARKTGVRTISLEVRLSNSGAQEFYRHLEFESSYLRPRYYPDGEAAVVMVKNV
ncbi:MAG TPA: ribosomal protein S18-alanine N-acetyltransferase [Thermoanaerobaculia bacterium]|jgi:ribosomal-protein-alanine N-acetyltransferase|nr:ribosomal protein S18-alanine N-acetyltransferase [Thermoanaerobaculia bacterium]